LEEANGGSGNHQQERDTVIERKLFSQEPNAKYGENGEGKALLNNLKLRRRKGSVTQAIGRDLKAVLEKGNPPRHKNHENQ
jgi:hypothetical protein